MASQAASPIALAHPEQEVTTAINVEFEFEEKSGSNSPQQTRPVSSSRAPNALSKLAASDSESEKDDVPVRRERGKLLSRLQPQLSEDSAESEDDNGAGAYERMKKKLLLSTGPGRQEPEKEQAEASQNNPRAGASSSSENEDDAPVRANGARRLLSKRRKTASPPRSRSPSVRSRRSSPGLFVTPDASPAAKKTHSVHPADADSDASPKPTLNADLQERVKRIRAEREAKQKQQRAQQSRKQIARRDVDDESESNSDGENGRRLTQQSKPTRKAGKKAMEAMVRDQQRIERNMQLTHQAKTKKRYSTKDLLAKFGYNQGNEESETAALPTPDASSLPATSDVEANQAHDTPPTSPPPFEDAPEKDAANLGIETPAATAAQARSSPPPPRLNKGKGRAPEFQHVPINPLATQLRTFTVQNARVSLKKHAPTVMVELSDSGDDLEIVETKSRFPVFDRLPEKNKQENPSLLRLRHLAHLTSPSKKLPKGQRSMNAMELQAALALKGRQQAQREREEKIEELRSRGIHVETEQEREKRQMEVDDMVAQFEKARQQDLKLGKYEKEQAKKNGETGDGLLSSDDSEDDDYVGSGDEEVAGEDEVDASNENVDLQLSGSEEEDEEIENGADEEEDFEEEEEEAAGKSNGLLDEMADESDIEETEEPPQEAQLDVDEDIEDEDIEAPVRARAVKRPRNVIVDDEDDSGDDAPQNGSPTRVATQDDAMAAFGFGFGNAAPALGLTQAFAGTMANLQSDSQDDQHVQEVEQDSLDFLRSLPDTQPGANFSQAADFLVPNSQMAPSQQDYSQDGLVSQIHLGISQLIETSPTFSRTQLSEIPEPTQDAGFLLSRSPAGLIPPPSTVDTVMTGVVGSPLMEKKGKLRRGRKEGPVELSDVDEDNASSGPDVEGEERAPKVKDAFSTLKKAAKKQRAIDDFNKKTSWAKDAVDEQAEESEDEYAGIGGASDDDSAAEEDEDLAKMIDTNDVKVNERQIAAFFAENARNENEKNTEKLYKDLMSGNLRKRAGGDGFDMSDSEDERQLRREKKQRLFKQMQKELRADERVDKIASNPKSAPFFNTIVDHDDDPDYEFLNAPEDLDAGTSQSQSEQPIENNEDIAIPDSQAGEVALTAVAPVNPLKRKSQDSQEKENRPPPTLRRTAAADNLIRKPITIADIQHSVSELLEDTRVIVPDSQYSESEDDAETPAPAPASRKPIIDRLTLSRTSTSTSTSTTTTTTANMAFHAPSASAHGPGFRVPSFLRRATSNFSVASESRTSSGASTPVEGGVRRGGTGRSNIHAQAREAERRAVLDKSEKKRKESIKKKIGKARGARSVLRDLGGGFE